MENDGGGEECHPSLRAMSEATQLAVIEGRHLTVVPSSKPLTGLLRVRSQ